MAVIVGAWIKHALLVAMVFFALFALKLFKDKLIVNRFKLVFWIVYVSLKLKLGFRTPSPRRLILL